MNAMSEIDEALSSGNLAYDIVTFPAVENIDSLSATNSVKRSRISSSLSKADDFHTNHIKKLTLFKWKNRNLRIKDKNELVLPEKEGHEMIIQRRVFFTWREIYGASRHNRTMTLRQSFSKFQSKMVYQLILKRYVMYVLKRRALCHLRQAFYGWQIKTTIDKESNINDLIARRHYLERKFRNVFLALQKNALANKQYRQYHDWCVQDMTKYRMYQCLIRWYTKRKSIQFYEHNTINTISTDFKIVTRLRNVCVDSLHQWRAVVLKKRRLQIAHIELIELIAQRLRCTAMKKWKKTFRHRIRDLRRYRVSVIQSHLILQKYMRKWCKVFQSKESNIENNFLMFRYIRKWRDWVITNRLKTNRSRSTQSSIAPFRNLPVVSIQSPKRRFDRCVNRSVDRSQYTVSRRVKEQHEPEVISDSTDQLMEVSQHFNRFVSLIQDRRNRRVLTDISINQHHLDRIRRKALDCLRKWRMTSALAHQYQLVTRVKNCVNITACWRAWMNYIKKQKAKRSLYQLARILHDKVIVINHIRSAFKRWLHRTRDNKKIARNTNNSIKCLQWTKLREFMLVLRARSKIAVMETQALTQVHRLSSCRRAMRWWRGWHGVRTLSNVLLLLADQQQKRFWFRLFFYNLRMRVHRLSNHPSTISVSESIRHVSFISAIPNDYNSTMSPVSINRKRYEPKSSSLSYKQVDHRSDDSIKSIDNKGNYDNKSVYSVGSSSQFTFQSMQSYASESVSQHSSLTPADSISLLRMRHNRSISKSASLDYTDRICNEADFFYEARLRAKRAWIFRLLRRKATQSRLLREVHQVASDHHKFYLLRKRFEEWLHVVLSRKQTRTNLDKKIISSNKLRGSFQPDTIIHPATAITNTAGRTVPRTFLFNHSFGSSYTAHTTAQSLSMESSVPVSVSPIKKQLSYSSSELSRQLAASVSSIVDKRKRSSTREAISNRSGNDNSRRRVPSLSKSMSAYDSLLCLSSLKHWQRINELNKRRAASTSLTQSLQVVAVLRHSFHAWKYLVSNRNESRDQSTNSVKNLHIRFELHRLIDTWSQAYHNRVNNSMSQNSLKRLFGRWHLTTTRSYTKRKQSQLLKKYLFKWKRFHITYKNLLTSHASNLVKQHTRSRQLITFETWKHKLRVIQAEQTLVHIRLRKYFHTWRNFHSKYLISKSVSLPLYPDDQYREYLICWRIATTYRRSVAFHMIVAPKFRKWLKLHREIQINKKTALQTANYQLKKKSVRDC